MHMLPLNGNHKLTVYDNHDVIYIKFFLQGQFSVYRNMTCEYSALPGMTAALPVCKGPFKTAFSFSKGPSTEK